MEARHPDRQRERWGGDGVYSRSTGAHVGSASCDQRGGRNRSRCGWRDLRRRGGFQIAQAVRQDPSVGMRCNSHFFTIPEPGSRTSWLKRCSSLGTQKSSWISVFGGARRKDFFSLTHGLVYALGALITMLSSSVSRSKRW